jgi:lipopolysaccharide transport system ATP-binding protein
MCCQDIRLLDEGLAVGDESFQRRCLQRLDEVRANGQTLVFVSHVMSDIERLCGRVVYLERGMVRAEGPPRDMIDLYLKNLEAMEGSPSGQGVAHVPPVVGPQGDQAVPPGSCTRSVPPAGLDRRPKAGG